MIDVRSLRNSPSEYYSSAEKRGFGREEIDGFFRLDEEWRSLVRNLNALRKQRNDFSAEIGKIVKSGGDPEEPKKKVKSVNDEISKLEARQKEVEKERDQFLSLIPNILHESVPVASGDENNKFVRFSGTARVFKEDLENFRSLTEGSGIFELIEKRPESHVDVIQRLNIADLERAAKISGARFYFLKNRLVKLELALINYAIDFLSQRGFTAVSPPLMMKYEPLSRTTDIDTFREALYKIEDDDLYMIATSEHPIGAMLMDEILDPHELPIRVAGISPCFRREAGAHGKDTKGIFRVHNFYKVEQFIFCRPEESWDFHEEITKNTEDLIRSLEIPYRVVNVCSGELSRLNSKKYDIEAWFPSQGTFREVASSSNNTDYQARSLNIRYRTPDGNRYVHTLNNTGLATTRMMVCIIENFQTDQGTIRIPEALIPYTGFEEIT